jgi:hypothetical protein
VPSSSDSSAGECFVVNPAQPTLGTKAGSNVVLGQPVLDTATLSGTAHQPGAGGPAGSVDGSIGTVGNPVTPGGPALGSITFTLFGPSATGCGALVFTSPPVAVSGDGPYSPPSFTPTLLGTYHWVASYTGDSPNTLSAGHNADCSDTGENVTVVSVASSLNTAQSFIPNDSATVSAPQGGDLAGTVHFAVFENTMCTGTPLYSQDVSVSGASPQTVSTSNTTMSTTAPVVWWQVSYTSTNPAQRSIPANCLETSDLVINNGGTISSP